jgi:hypothetical protein
VAAMLVIMAAIVNFRLGRNCPPGKAQPDRAAMS